MRRFFVNPEDITNEKVYIKDDDAHHLSQVLRLKEGEQIIVFAGTGVEYLVEINDISTGLVIGDILGVTSSQRDSHVNVTLVQGIPKGDKMDLIVQKCTEVGIARIIPVLTERTVVKLDKDKQKKRQDRWQKIAQEASKQCQRATVPQIEDICTWPQYFAKNDLLGPTLVLWENESSYGLKAFLKENTELEHITLVIGPEGGLSRQEVKQLLARGASTVTLGPRILRTETAGLAALIMVLYELGDLG
ncbi:MAG: 16S rRNA (uracil(1498)-N(3))-methyltransferase [Peptococcales bacterium]|jgi:16S rRNA (uracil1498-N3)-methyltransferase